MKYTEATWPTSEYPNFTFREFADRINGECDMDPTFLTMLQSLRNAYGKSMRITSGYRSPTSPVELKKPGGPGAHTHGVAADIAIQGEEAYHLIRLAFLRGFLGIGIKQHGEGRYVHLDMASHVHRPMIWSYS